MVYKYFQSISFKLVSERNCMSALFFLHCCVAVTLSQPSLLIRKCCPLHQQLDDTRQKCLEYSTNGTESNVTKEFILHGMKHPWWLDENVPFVSSEDPALRNQVDTFIGDPSKFIEYGVKQPCAHRKTRAIGTQTNDYDIMDNGTLIYYSQPDHRGKNASFGPESYCADRVASEYFVYLLCPCDVIACVHKCCGVNQDLSVVVNRKKTDPLCVNRRGSAYWRPEFFVDKWNRSEEEPVFALIPTSVECPKDSTVVVVNNKAGDNLNFSVLMNGSAIVDNYNHGKPFDPDQYCADDSMLVGEEEIPGIVICLKDGGGKGLEWVDIFYGTLFAVGVLFLVATLATYAVLPELRNEPSKLLMMHTASLLVAYTSSVVGQFKENMPIDSCYALAFIVQWSFLATFFWLNVMCIDMSWAFSGFQRSRSPKAFLYYSLYAWGCPSAITIITAIMEFVKEIPDTHVIKPDLGITVCWFDDQLSTLAYFYGPIAVLLLSNIALFVFTAVKIVIAKRDTAAILNKNGRKDKQRFLMYAKLFVLMGATWITEIIPWALQSEMHLWKVTDLINMLRAVFIFVIFCCKSKVLKLLRKRMHELLPRWCPAGIASDSTTSSTSTQKTDISLEQINKDTISEHSH